MARKSDIANSTSPNSYIQIIDENNIAKDNHTAATYKNEKAGINTCKENEVNEYGQQVWLILLHGT